MNSKAKFWLVASLLCSITLILFPVENLQSSTTPHNFSITNESNVVVDSDGDGIDDSVDLDDDNDGILDSNETVCGASITDFTFYGDAVESVSAQTITLTSPGAWRTSYSNETLSLPIHLEFLADNSRYRMIGFLAVGATERLDNWNDGSHKVYTSQNNWIYGKFPSSSWDFFMQDFTNKIVEIDIETTGRLTVKLDGNIIYTGVAPVSDYKFSISSNNGGTFDDVFISHSQQPCSSQDIDTDTDGIPNRLDLDSDGDNCVDAFEASGDFDLTNMDGNGRLIGGVDMNPASQSYGVPLIAGALGQGIGESTITQTLSVDVRDCICIAANSPVDSDSDGVCDDVDFCDNIANHLLGTSCDDGNSNTVNDVWDINTCSCAGLASCSGSDPDSDGDGICDLIDLDDDNDGIPDKEESLCSYQSLTNLDMYGSAIESLADTEIFLDSLNAWRTSYSNDVYSLPIHLEFTADTDYYSMIGFLPVGYAENPNDYRDGAYKLFIHLNGRVYGKLANLWTFNTGGIDDGLIEFDIDLDGNLTVKLNGQEIYAGTAPISDYKFTVSSHSGGSIRDLAIRHSQTSCINFDMDTDHDGIPNRLDLDSDNDNCVDAFEGDGSFQIASMDQDGRLTGGVNTNPGSPQFGMPTIAGNGQGFGLSREEYLIVPDRRACLCLNTSNPPDSDADGICDSADVCEGFDDNLIGTSCNDNDDCTINDVWTVNCACAGELFDTDGDNICDIDDACPDFDDDVDIDDDNIPDCIDNCIDVDEDEICDDVDSDITVNKLKVYTSHRRGFYELAFDQYLYCNDANAVIYYTLDGSRPTTASQVFNGNPIAINTTTILRTLAANTQLASEIKTHSFIFLDDVIASSLMKSYMTLHPIWGGQLKDAMLSIPSISLVSDSTVNEITNVSGSMEMLFVDKDDNFQENCGLGHYGNASLSFQKRNVRMYFDEEYGAKNLKKNVFDGFANGVGAADKFDKLDLRSSHESFLWNTLTEWHKGETYIATKLMDDIMLRGGNPNPHNRFVHVYIDGKYWGQFDLREKFDDNLLPEYKGGDNEEYNFISGSKVTVSAFHPIDGIVKDSVNNDWEELINASHNYATWKTMANENGLFDLMVLFMYGFAEAEWNAVGSHTNGHEFEFQINDADLFFSRGLPLWTNRTYPQQHANGPGNMFLNLYNEGDPDFIMEFGDRASMLLDYNGGLTPNALRDHMDELAAMIEMSMIAESARWSDDSSENPNLWLHRLETFKTDMADVRADIVKSQMKKTGVYPILDPVVFPTASGLVPQNSSVNLVNPNQQGAVYYTLNGTDPRASGGSLNPSAQVYQNPIPIHNGALQIQARVKGTETSFPEINIALNKSVTVSHLSSGPIETVTDGDVWSIAPSGLATVTSTSGVNPWIDIDLESVQQIDAVRYWNRSNWVVDTADVNTHIFISNQPFASETLADLVADPSVQTFIVPGLTVDMFELEINAQGRYVRMMFNERNLIYCPELEVLQHDTSNPQSKDVWSPMVPQNYYTLQEYENLVINEIHYNPNDEILIHPESNMLDTISGRNFEFVEIANNGDVDVHLLGTRFSKGIQYEIEDLIVVQPDSFVVFAEDEFWFEHKYGFAPDGKYSGKLDNGGEKINYKDPFDNIIDSLKYDDGGDWPGTADKGLYSLGLKDKSLDNAVPTNWAIQSVFTTPRAENYFTDFGNHGYSGLVINEIHYNPFDSIDQISGEEISGRKFEFIEIKNVSAAEIDLTDVEFTRGVTYAFPVGTKIQPNEFIVLAEDKSSFEDRYGFPPFDKYDGKLDNEGEILWLQKITDDGPITLDAVTYSSSFPWDTQANGGLHDYSLALIDGSVNNASRLNWKIQCNSLFTPGSENDFSCFNGLQYPGLTINEIHYKPAGGIDLEYLEIANHSNILINLEDVSLSSGIFYVFESVFLPSASASPANKIVLAKDSTAFHNAYGMAPHGEYIGSLGDDGETLRIQDIFGVLIDEVTYSNAAPWNSTASQGNHSLALMDGSLDNSLPENWCVQDVGTSPFVENSFNDTDNDMIIDCLDSCPGLDNSLFGTSCEDGDPCTSGETYDAMCNCSGGSFQDADGDGVCDENDACDGQDDALIGSACSDGDPCTEGETYDGNCACTGGVFQDSDGDGICDANDACVGQDDADIGASCNDGDPCTSGETFDAMCNCTGGTFQDADGDGVCDTDDQCANFDDALIGQPCNDGDSCTTGETYQPNCNCGGGALLDANNNDVCDMFDGTCNVIYLEDFEAGTGIWQTGGGDAHYLMNSNSPEGDYSLRIRDNSGVNSSIYTSSLDLSSVEMLKLRFQYQAIGMETSKSFALQISQDNGSSFTTIQTWVADTDFINNDVYLEELNIPATQLSDEVVVRFECFGTINSDEVFLDKIILESCQECVDSISELSFPTIQNNASARLSIESNGTVKSGFDVNYNAGESIELLNGFEIEPGSTFHAFIQPCN